MTTQRAVDAADPAAGMGRRERKKARTRQALAEAALRLFTERGYDQVTVAQIAEEADVAVATLFKHVPDGKEALIFDDGVERREGLVAAVRERPEGQSIIAALRAFMGGRGPFLADPSPEFRRRTALITGTPALRDHSRKLWIASEDALAEAVAAEAGRDPADMTVRALVRYALEVPDLAGTAADPRAAMDAVFDLLEAGWPGP
ncbi:MAG: TetR/AcrR family transcriptional regulator [Actinomycetia bacterium]|nr:TetR/AcrR family transcriptional regulator [Actinomycetes bacterium]MCL2732128.1 TetR/AcrR family transcriptional regulator [Actinomycetes bacterium]